jgi:hypothetical protein
MTLPCCLGDGLPETCTSEAGNNLKIFGCLYFTYYQRNADITNYVF